jgi:L-fuconolactonase
MIDAHAHLVTPDTTAFPPVPLGGGTLPKSVMENHLTVEALLAHLDRLGLQRAVAVQRAHVYGYNNAYVLHAAHVAGDRVAAVACIDAAAPDSAAVASRLIAEGARGLRFTSPTTGNADCSWFSGEHARGVWSAAEAGRASLCLHLFRWNRDAGVADLVALLERFPGVPIVLDHVGNPVSEDEDFGLAALAPLEPFSQLCMKLTTINFEYVRKAGGDIAAFTAAVVARFGADRVMWGSDVAQSAGMYDGFVADARTATATLSEADRADVLSATAARMYFTAT